jgi:hypothetical protein
MGSRTHSLVEVCVVHNEQRKGGLKATRTFPVCLYDTKIQATILELNPKRLENNALSMVMDFTGNFTLFADLEIMFDYGSD